MTIKRTVSNVTPHSVELTTNIGVAAASTPNTPSSSGIAGAVTGLPTSITGAYDNVGPIQGNLNNGARTDDTQPELRGQGQPNSVVKLYEGKTYLGSALVNADGEWSFPLRQHLAAGEHEFIVTDVLGAQTNPGFSLHIEAPSTPLPAPSIGSAFDNAGYNQGNLNHGASTDDTRPQLSGKGPADSVVTVYDGDTLLGSAIVDGNGTWTFTVQQDLSAGEHTFTAVNNAGLRSPEFSLSIDEGAPALSINSAFDNVGAVQGVIASGTRTDDARPGLSGQGKSNEVIRIYDGEQLLGSTVVNNAGNWFFEPGRDLSLGEHHLFALSNSGERSDVFSVTVGQQSPLINFFHDNVGDETGFLPGNVSTDDTQPTFFGNGVPNSVVTFFDGADVIGSVQTGRDGGWQFTPQEALAPADHVFSVIGANGEASNLFELHIEGEIPASDVLTLTLADVLADDGGGWFVSAGDEYVGVVSIADLQLDAQTFAYDSSLALLQTGNASGATYDNLALYSLMEQFQQQPVI